MTSTDSRYTVLGDRIVLFHNAVKNPEYVIKLATDAGWEQNLGDQYEDGIYRRYESSVRIERDNEDSLLVLTYLGDALSLYAEVVGSTVDPSNYDIGPFWLAHVSKYIVGGRAKIHRDEDYQYDNGIYTNIVYLNDDYEGGEVTFSDYNVTVKQSAGDVLVFPSYYLHYSDPVTSGDKYMAISRLRY